MHLCHGLPYPSGQHRLPEAFLKLQTPLFGLVANQSPRAAASLSVASPRSLRFDGPQMLARLHRDDQLLRLKAKIQTIAGQIGAEHLTIARLKSNC
jgi:hypothetical protein